MKKILLIDDNYHSSDRGSFLNVFERDFLIAHGYDVFTFSFPNEMPPDLSGNDYVFLSPKNYLLQKVHKFAGCRHARNSLRQAIETIHPDLVHCHLIAKYPMDVYRALDGSIPIVQTLHGPNLFCTTSWGCRRGSLPCEMGIGAKCCLRGCATLPNTALYSYLNSKVWGNVTKKVSIFHCPSRHIMNTALGLGIDNVAHVPLGINDRFMGVQKREPKGPPTLIFVGSIEECKGIHVLIEAMTTVLKAIPDARLRIAGKGSLVETLVKRVRDRGMEQSITFLGRISHTALLEEYTNSDLFVIPSVWQEQFGLVGPEAMACGLPCVGSDIGGIREWLMHGVFGLLVPPGNVEHLAAAIIKYLSNRPDAHRQGLLAQQYSRQYYQSSVYGERLIELFEEQMSH